MGHADLRIRERTLPAVADRAYELLRDRTRLAAFVQKMLTAHHAEAADRAAVDLEDRDTPARLVVTWEGHAVTCLGPGMVTDAPVIPWPRTRAYLDRQALSLRTRIAAGRAEDEDTADAQMRLYTHPHRLTRAEFDALVVLAPLLVPQMAEVLGDAERALSTTMRRARWDLDRPVQFEVVDACYRLVQVSALLLLATQGEPLAQMHPLLAMNMEDVTLARTGWWVLMAQPLRSLGALEALAHNDRARTTESLPLTLRALLALTMRYPWLRARAFTVAQHVRARLGLPAMGAAELDAGLLSGRRGVLGSTVIFLDALTRARSRSAVETVTGDPAAVNARIHAGETMDLEVAAGWLGPAQLELARAWAPLRNSEAEPRWRPLPAGRADADELFRADAWRDLFTACPVPIARMDPLAVALSHASPEAMVPDDRVRRRFTHRQLLDSFVGPQLTVRRMVRDDGDAAPRGPVRAEEKPGPNAPCSCGSGKKYKKCCGAA